MTRATRRNWHRQSDGENRARPANPVSSRDRASHGLNKAAANGKAEPCAGTLPIRASNPIELVKKPIEIGLRNTLTFIKHPDGDGTTLKSRHDHDARPWRRIFRRIVKEIEQHLFHQH